MVTDCCSSGHTSAGASGGYGTDRNAKPGSGCCADSNPGCGKGDEGRFESDEYRADCDGGSVLCLAVVRDSGRKVDVFDARGDARSFSADSASPSGIAGPKKPGTGGEVGEVGDHKSAGGKLCFSTHGLGSGDCDGLLTPCFDENGEHGEPEEGCFCGVDTPHLHAHVHDPERCDADAGGGSGCGGAGAKGAGDGSGSVEADVGFLAQLTLHPVDDEERERKHAPNAPGEDEGASLIRMPVTASLPKQCNSRELTRQLSQHGMERKGRRMYKVQHDDHYDYLVHNSSTGNLHLEHPCKTCGDNDLHGNFHLVHKRSWRDADDERGFRLHFFEAAKQPFSILDVLADLFDLDSDRARAVRCDDILCEVCDADKRQTQKGGTLLGHGGNSLRKVGNFVLDRPHHDTKGPPLTCTVRTVGKVSPEQKSGMPCCAAKVASFEGADGIISKESLPFTPPAAGADAMVRSQFHVAKICCASEIPAINSIVKPLPGVTKVLINTTTKMVYVDHDPADTTAASIEVALNKAKFGARLKSDGAAEAGVAAAAAAPRVGRSQFFVEKICCASEIPAIKSIVQPLRGVESLSINVTTKTVYVDHDTDVVSAADIALALNEQHFGARIKKDAGQALAMMTGLPTTSFVESSISIVNIQAEGQKRAIGVILNKFPDGQIRGHSVHLPTKTVKVEHNPYLLSATTIVEALRKEGFDASILVDGAADGTWALALLGEKDDDIEHHASKVNPFVVLSGLCWVISMLSFIGGNWEYLKYVGLLSVVLGLPPIAMKAFRTLRRYHFDANCMMLFAALGAVGLQEYHEAAAVTFLFAISEALETRATARARNALSAIVSLRPDRANLINPITKEIVVVPAGAVAVGAIVSVRTGDKIPCDGIVIEGYSTVDESSLTGESRPVSKGPKDTVSGGTINSGTTQLIVRTTATVDNSAVARLIRLVEEAQANRSPTEKLVDEFAKRYTPLVVLAALSMCTIPWAWGKEVGREWTMIGLITMVIACPCALIISTPVTYVAGLAATAQKGVIIKGGSHLEALGQVKKIALDKTGTLTEGSFALLHLNIIDGRRTRKEVLEYLALMEAPSSHPLASALVAAARNEGVTIPKDVSVLNHTILKGEGVTAAVDGLAVHVGNARLFQRLGLFDMLPEKDKAMTDEWAMAGGTVGFISIEGVGIVGAYSVADAIRPESRTVVDGLSSLGIEVNMLTGDGRDAALAIGNQVGLLPGNIHSQLLPEDKLDLVSKMKGEGSSRKSLFCKKDNRRSNVLMCGDGVNDAPALALADVGVAMGAGATLAMETSDVTLMDSNLNKLLYSIRMGKRVLRTILENVIFSLAAKAVVMGFTFAGKATLWAAIGSDVGAMLIVTLNGMRLLPSKKKVNMMAVLHQEKERDIEAADLSFTTAEDNNVTAHGCICRDNSENVKEGEFSPQCITSSNCCKMKERRLSAATSGMVPSGARAIQRATSYKLSKSLPRPPPPQQAFPSAPEATAAPSTRETPDETPEGAAKSGEGAPLLATAVASGAARPSSAAAERMKEKLERRRRSRLGRRTSASAEEAGSGDSGVVVASSSAHHGAAAASRALPIDGGGGGGGGVGARKGRSDESMQDLMDRTRERMMAKQDEMERRRRERAEEEESEPAAPFAPTGAEAARASSSPAGRPRPRKISTTHRPRSVVASTGRAPSGRQGGVSRGRFSAMPSSAAPRAGRSSRPDRPDSRERPEDRLRPSGVFAEDPSATERRRGPGNPGESGGAVRATTVGAAAAAAGARGIGPSATAPAAADRGRRGRRN